jgi:DNA helicase II / ATP-dependent DNA helicase PcrA
MNQLPQAYLQAKANLNAIQREAVYAIEGPVMVLAGPGTGKTQILSTRIAYMLLEAGLDIQPDNILCLTFTEAGVLSMRKRLQKLIGPLSYRVSVHTYHAFCNSVIQAHPEHFGSLRSLQQIAPIETRLIIKQLLQALPPDNPLRRLNESSYNEASNIEKLHADLKKEAISSDALIQSIEEYLNSLPEDPEYIYKRSGTTNKGETYTKGEPKWNSIRQEERKLSKTVAAAQLYEPYEKLKSAQGFYDYDDMILWVRRAFAENPDELLLPYQERYQYVLVDEYQDSNGSQTDLLKQLVSYWGDQANVFIVGDDDQAIYRFQGAELKNFVEFLDWYPAARVFSLVENYRSTQSILDASCSFIAQNQQRLLNEPALQQGGKQLSKDLQEARTNLGPPIPPEIHAFADHADEMAWVACEVQNSIEAGVPPNKIAILYRKHRLGADLVQAFTAREIPIQLRRAKDVLEDPLAEALLDLLGVVARLHAQLKGNGQDAFGYNEGLGMVLLQEWWQLPAIPLQLCLADYQQQRWQSKQLELVEYFLQLEPSALIPKSFLDSVKALLEDIYHWAQRLETETLAQVLARMLNRGGLLTWLLAQPMPLELLGVIRSLTDFAEEWCSRRPNTTLPEMLKVLEEMRTEGISLPLNELSSHGDGVFMSTVHGAKGLEFETVFMIDCTENGWSDSRQSQKLALPPTLTFKSKENDEEDDRRLFYVGMTRAERRLVISWSTYESRGKEKGPHKFVTELQQTAKLEENVFTPPVGWEAVQLQYLADSFRVPEHRPEELLPADNLREMLVNYRLSPSDLSTYLHCPRQFYYKRLLDLPSIKDPYKSFGDAVHYTLFDYFSEFAREKRLPSQARLLELFILQMRQKQGLFPAERYEFYVEYGKTYLPQYFDARQATWATQTQIQLEKRYTADLDGIPLVGKVDKLVIDSNGYSVIDYKTGKHKKDRLASPSEKVPYGGDYWLQMTFYRFLLEHSNLLGKYHKGVIDYIQPEHDQFEIAEIHMTDESGQQLESFIREAWAGIQALDFPKVMPDEVAEKCEYCAYKRMCWA